MVPALAPAGPSGLCLDSVTEPAQRAEAGVPHRIRDWSRTFSWAGAPEGPSTRLHVSLGLPRLRCVDLDERGFSAQPAECGVPCGTGHPPRLSHRETRPASRCAQPPHAPSFSRSRG